MKDYNIAVSIIVPVHNAGSHLYKCLDSLLSQTLKNIEIIIVVDCPTDGSDSIVEEYAAKDSRIVVIHNKENLHIGNSRNEGLKIARGKYIGFSDHDDYCDSRMYEILYEKAVRENLDIVCSPYVNRRISGNKENFFSLDDCPEVSIDCLPNIIFENTVGRIYDTDPKIFSYCTVWNKIFSSEIIKVYNIEFVDTKKINAEDNLFILNHSFYSKKAGYINKPLYYHNIGINNTGNTLSYRNINHTIAYIENMKSCLIQQDILVGGIKKRFDSTVVFYICKAILFQGKHNQSIFSVVKFLNQLKKNETIIEAFANTKMLYFHTPNWRKKMVYFFMRMWICLSKRN